MQGVSFSVSAGNDAGDACKKSPASATDWYVHLDSFACIFSVIIVPINMQNYAHTHSVTVGATDSEDKMSTFSNYGKCVDIFAPVS